MTGKVSLLALLYSRCATRAILYILAHNGRTIKTTNANCSRKEWEIENKTFTAWTKRK